MQRVTFRLAGRRALRVAAVLRPGTRVLRVRLYRVTAHGRRLVATAVRRTGSATTYRMTLHVPWRGGDGGGKRWSPGNATNANDTNANDTNAFVRFGKDRDCRSLLPVICRDLL